MISATERLTLKSSGILRWLRDALRGSGGPRRLRVQDLPADLRRDIGLEMEDDVLCGRELAGQRLLDLTRPGVM